MQHDARVGQSVSFPLNTGSEQYGCHAGGLSKAKGGHIGFDVLHGVVNRHASSNQTTRGVDVEMDILVGVFRFQKEHLSNDHVGDIVGNGGTQKDNAVTQ